MRVDVVHEVPVGSRCFRLNARGRGFIGAGHAGVAHVRACCVLLLLDTIEGQIDHRGELCVVLHESHDLVVRHLNELANDLWCELSANHLLDWVAQQAAELLSLIHI